MLSFKNVKVSLIDCKIQSVNDNGIHKRNTYHRGMRIGLVVNKSICDQNEENHVKNTLYVHLF